MTEKSKIESVSDFVKAINTFPLIMNNSSFDGRSHIPATTFFRGQASNHKNTNLQAGVFRSKNSEFSLTHTYTNMFDQTFRNMSNNGERLAQMQHYGLATRLLDVSSLPLVALYFAVCDSEDDRRKDFDDGLVFILGSCPIFKINEHDEQLLLKTANSDHLEIMSTIALLDTQKKQEINLDLAHFNEIYKLILNEFNSSDSKISLEKLKLHFKDSLGYGAENDDDFLQAEAEELDGFYTPREISKTIIVCRQYLDQLRSLNKELNSNPAIKALYHAIRTDIGDFTTDIDFESLQIPFFFEPPINNERIKAQHGYFLFEPFFDDGKGNLEDILKLQEAFCLKNNTLIIDGSKKRSILTDLDKNYGINRHCLFPDYSNGALYVNMNK